MLFSLSLYLLSLMFPYHGYSYTSSSFYDAFTKRNSNMRAFSFIYNPRRLHAALMAPLLNTLTSSYELFSTKFERNYGTIAPIDTRFKKIMPAFGVNFGNHNQFSNFTGHLQLPTNFCIPLKPPLKNRYFRFLHVL